MFLKKLELFGFKSFPQKTSLEFEKGITGIVGPNGCGKSNISDAIKWVLGEQSAKQMRGDKMGDVLFNGTATMPPYNIAEVSMTFDNTEKVLPIEYSEVTITRRLIRTGDSEYYINKNICRLKDIHQIFFGTGVGTSAYSVIEQGRIGQILNMKPEDRRYIFEEAAGITKYKAHKKEALRKLQATEQNLLRASDITSEIKRQLNSITRQVNKARRYNETYSALKELDLKVFYFEMTQLKNDIASLVYEKKDLKGREEKLTADVSSKEARIEEIRSHLLELSEETQRINESYVDGDKKMSLFESKIDFDRDRIDEIEENISKISEENEASKIKIKDLELQIVSVENALRQSRSKKMSQEEKLRECLGDLNECESLIAQRELLLENRENENVDIISRTSREKNEAEALRVSIEHLSRHKEKADASRSECLEKQSDIVRRLSDKKIELDHIKNKIKEAEIKELAAAYLIDSNLSYQEYLRSLLDKESLEKGALYSRLNMLLEWKRVGEGYVDGVKAACQFALDSIDGMEAIHGPVAGLVTLNEKYALAIEAALHDDLQTIVVDDPQTAKLLIAHLSRGQLGNAKFLIRTRNENADKGHRSPLPDIPGVYGYAMDFVYFNEDFRGVFNNFLSDALIVEDYEIAQNIIRLGRWSGKIVTILGECFEDGGLLIRGGSPDAKAKDLLLRDTQISELRRDVDKTMMQEQKYECHIAAIGQHVESENRKRTGLLGKQQALRSDFSGLEKEYSRLEWHGRQLSDELFVIDAENMDLNKNMCEHVTAFKEKEKSAEGLRKEHIKITDQIDLARRDLRDNKDKQESIRNTVGDYRIELAGLVEKISGQGGRQARILEQMREESSQKEDRAFHLEELVSRKERLLVEAGEVQEKIRGLRQDTESLRCSLEMKKKDRDSISAELDNESAGLKIAQQELRGIRERLSGLDVRETELRMTCDNKDDIMENTYHIRFLSLSEEYRVSFIEEPWRDDIAGMKEKLESMGPVNHGAIEENEELGARYKFLIEQQEDLMQAKESLQKVIRKINITTKKQFIETFESVRRHFGDYYKILFNGGHAELILVDEDNVLESGVDIVARPPGKKLQNISLLSGGEKALTAIAILFALFKVRPSPFCMLDEIDAPLDDANIERFLALLQEFIHNTQFIIISHNKKTISIADTLYGITMEVPGISKLISVKLVEKDELGVGEMSA